MFARGWRIDDFKERGAGLPDRSGEQGESYFARVFTRASRQARQNRRDGLLAQYQEQDQPGQIHGGVSDPMPRGYRCAVLAAFGWLILVAAADNHIDPNSHVQAEQISASGRIANALDDLVSLGVNEANERADGTRETEPCAQGKDKRYSDLCAQWKAADSAAWGAVWAALGAGFSGLGLIGVAIAILLTIQSNEIARDTARRQLRPYVFVSDVAVEIVSKGTKTKGKVEVCILVTLKNVGLTPARIISISEQSTLTLKGVESNDSRLSFNKQTLGPQTTLIFRNQHTLECAGRLPPFERVLVNFGVEYDHGGNAPERDLTTWLCVEKLNPSRVVKRYELTRISQLDAAGYEQLKALQAEAGEG